MSTVKDLEEWLNVEPPVSVRSTEKPRSRAKTLGWDSRNNTTLIYDCIEAAQSESGSVLNTTKIHGENREVAFVLKYKISDVEIVQLCNPDHDFTEWRYDFTGGDIRNCRRCGLYEHI